MTLMACTCFDRVIMLRMKVTICEPKSDGEFEKYYELRWDVLRRPWNQPRESEKDEFESDAIHIMACIDNDVIGVGRIHSKSNGKIQIRYMAVMENFRCKGIGTLILRELESRAEKMGAKHVILNARESALGFYRRNGYRITGRADTLFRVISHWKMQKDLESNDDSSLK